MYLGLVLVGATPGVLAQHAATTKVFELKDEIENTDDLDKDPDRSSLSNSIKTYFEDVEGFLVGLQRLGKRGAFDANRDYFEVAQRTLLPCVAGNKIGSYTADKFDAANPATKPLLERFGKLLTDGYSLADCLPTGRFQGQDATHSQFVLRLDDNNFSVEVGVRKRSASDASRFLGSLGRAIEIFKAKHDPAHVGKIFDATSVRSRDDQVFIVTRLPRAALDTLLAENAK